MLTEVAISLQSMLHKRASRWMEENGGLVSPIGTVCLDEILRFFANRERGREKPERENRT